MKLGTAGWLLAVLLVLPATVLSGEEPPVKEKPDEGNAAREALKDRQKQEEKRAEMARAKELISKKQRGEELTQDERNWIEEHAKRAEKAERKGMKERGQGEEPGGPKFGPPRGPGEDRPPPFPPDLNALDLAQLELARVHAEKGRTDEAIGILKTVIEKSPDPAGKSAAAFYLARLLQEKGDAEGAKANLRLVTSGPMADPARDQLVEPFVREGKFPEAMAEIMPFVKNAGTPLDKVRALRHYVEIARRSKNDDLYVKALKEVPGLITYDEAKKAQEQAAKEGAAQRGQMGPPWLRPGGPEGQGPGFDEARRKFMEAMPEELRDKVREFKDMPPDERRKATLDAWAKVIQDAQKAGDLEKAQRLNEMMYRFVKFREDRPGKGMKGEGPNPERLKADIKELEDQGRFEEAKKLRKALEGANGRRAPGEEGGDF